MSGSRLRLNQDSNQAPVRQEQDVTGCRQGGYGIVDPFRQQALLSLPSQDCENRHDDR